MKPELQDAFMEEGRQLIALMRRELAAGAEGPAPLRELFRCAHMLKENAQLAEFPELEMIVAPLASYLRLAKHTMALTPEQAATASEALEACANVLERRETPRLPALLRRLRGAKTQLDPRETDGPAIRLLLIEDSDMQAAIIRKELADSQGDAFVFERKEFLSGGIERIAEGGVDVVLLDLNLPDSEGLESFKKISRKAPAMPIVILTVADDDAMAMSALREGAQDFLVKGQIDARNLHRAVRYAIERKRIEQSLQRSRSVLERRISESTSELRKANHELALFAAAASHELRQPLRKITAWGELLREKCASALGDTGLRLLGEMQQGALRLGDVIDSLRDLTRVSTHGRPLENIELDAVLGEVAADMAPLLAQTGGRLVVDRLPALRADRVQMRQLFENLLSNAIKYRSADRPLLVSVRARSVRAEIEIAVEDNGIGFDQKYADRIFQPFQRLHGPGAYEGAGMGLAICARIVARHKGFISARGEAGKGARFTVTLPLAEAAK